MTFTFTHENTKFRLSRLYNKHCITILHKDLEVFTHVVADYRLSGSGFDLGKLEHTETRDLEWEEWFHFSFGWQQDLSRLKALMIEVIRNELEAQ